MNDAKSGADRKLASLACRQSAMRCMRAEITFGGLIINVVQQLNGMMIELCRKIIRIWSRTDYPCSAHHMVTLFNKQKTQSSSISRTHTCTHRATSERERTSARTRSCNRGSTQCTSHTPHTVHYILCVIVSTHHRRTMSALGVNVCVY